VSLQWRDEAFFIVVKGDERLVFGIVDSRAWWGIDERDGYTLTHIPSGRRVASHRTRKSLEQLAEELTPLAAWGRIKGIPCEDVRRRIEPVIGAWRRREAQ